MCRRCSLTRASGQEASRTDAEADALRSPSLAGVSTAGSNPPAARPRGRVTMVDGRPEGQGRPRGAPSPLSGGAGVGNGLNMTTTGVRAPGVGVRRMRRHLRRGCNGGNRAPRVAGPRTCRALAAAAGLRAAGCLRAARSPWEQAGGRSRDSTPRRRCRCRCPSASSGTARPRRSSTGSRRGGRPWALADRGRCGEGAPGAARARHLPIPALPVLRCADGGQGHHAAPHARADEPEGRARDSALGRRHDAEHSRQRGAL
jgi:hypothetical protein